ncbi:MAG TPA: tetratricopeptide repeat protein [Thermoanaerobaculia bacterium]
MSNDESRGRPLNPPPAADLETQPTQVTPNERVGRSQSSPPWPSSPGAAPPGAAPAEAPPASWTGEERILAPGTVVAGRYRVLGVLGVGGMGVVYRAYDEMLDLELALKVLRPEIARNADFIQRFRNELVLARQVSHRHVVSNYDVGVHEGLHFMTMDLVVGRSLDDVLRERGKLPLAEAVRLVRQVAGALAEAHRRGIVHRDLKPANILLDQNGDACVTDFGIARTLGSGLTRTGEILGTPAYLSPEQARGEHVDGRSDLFTLGLIFIQLLTGKLPFPGGTLLEVVAQRMYGKVKNLEALGLQAPPEIVRVIERCVESDPARRYQTADELLEDLAEPGRRRRGPSARAVVWAAVALLAVGAGAFLLGRQEFLSRPAPTPAPLDSGVSGVEASPPAVELPEPEPLHSVAVLPFPVAAGSPTLGWASNGVAEMLATALAENEDLRVVASVRVFQILQDLGFQPAALRGDELEQLADLLRVDRLVFGDLRAVDGQVELGMRLMEAELPGSPSRLVETRRGELRQLFDLVDLLAADLRAALKVEAADRGPAPMTPSAAAMEAYTEGLDFLSRRDTLRATPALERAVAEDPDFAAAWVRLSQAYLSLGRYDEALEAAGKAVAATAADAAAGGGGRIVYEAQAQQALVRGEPEEAQRFLEELVRRYPNDTGARVALAEAYAQQGKFAEAISRLEEAVAVDPGDARAWYLLGRCSIQNGDHRVAVDEYLAQALSHQRELKNVQGEAEVLNALGAGYEYLGDLELASRNYEAAVDIRGEIGDQRGLAISSTNLGRIHLAQSRYDEAESRFAAALDIHKALGNQAGIAEIYNIFGTLGEERGRYPEALEHYKRALNERTALGDERALAESHANVGYVYYLLGEYDNALLYLERALGSFQKNEDQRGIMLTLQSVGFCQLARGSWPEALKSFLRSLELSREAGEKVVTSVSLGNLGIISHYQGRYSAAFASYRDALAILDEIGHTRGQVEFTLQQAEALVELGQLERAEAKLARVEELQAAGGNREQRAALLTLEGHLALERGDAAAAAASFTAAMAEAEASQSAVARIRARIGEGLAALERDRIDAALGPLAAAAADADKLGNAILQLRAGEALARAALRAGDPGRADDAVRKALRVVKEGGSYARGYRLHQLLAEALDRRGDAAAAAGELTRARAELGRVRSNLDDEQRASFDRLPSVRELLGGEGEP